MMGEQKLNLGLYSLKEETLFLKKSRAYLFRTFRKLRLIKSARITMIIANIISFDGFVQLLILLL